jgi:hypothetical protein
LKGGEGEMSENKITTNHIEEVLMKKEKVEFIGEVYKAVNDLANILNTFTPDGDDESKAYKAWIESFFIISHRVFIQGSKIENLPKYMECMLLKKAVDDFIRSVEETKATLDSLDC